MKRTLLVLCLLPGSAIGAVSYGGFIDTYYAYDFNDPASGDRLYTTQPARHDEFNINLAFVEAVLKEDTRRGRLALQYGTSVDVNYLAENNKSIQTLQEAYAGTKLSDKLWVDAGIFLGNIGAESWISRDNWTYTRALNLDYVPYYSSGVRFEYLINAKETFQFQILNGWQTIQENNHGKAVGMQYKKVINEQLTFTYNNFFGDEQVVLNVKNTTAEFPKGTRNPRFRQYHNFILQWLATEKWQFLGAIDFGAQSQQANKGVDGLFVTTLTARRVLSAADAIAVRGEYYDDPNQTNVQTNTKHGFQVVGASANYDHKFDEKVTWRTELRILKSKDRIYPKGRANFSDTDSFLVTSLGITF